MERTATSTECHVDRSRIPQTRHLVGQFGMRSVNMWGSPSDGALRLSLHRFSDARPEKRVFETPAGPLFILLELRRTEGMSGLNVIYRKIAIRRLT